jgi:RNA polymerase sigma-70 factor (ECF subfamily)
MSKSTLSQIEDCLARLSTDPAAREELIAVTSSRLHRLVERMLRQNFGRLARWEDADDVLQNAHLRLCRVLRDVAPATPLDFMRLATLQVRRELIDLSRHYFGPNGEGARHHSIGESADTPSPGFESPDSTYNPVRLAEWTDFHEAVEHLPPAEREVTELLWYQGLTQDEAAGLLGVDVRTVKRRWLRAKLALHAVIRSDAISEEPN